MKTFTFASEPLTHDLILPDVVINFWADVYLSNPIIRAHGVLFGTFLMAPHEILHAVVMASIEVAPGLLARQRAVRRRLDEAARAEQLPLDLDAVIVALEHKGARVSDGAWIEPLRHRAWPRNVKRTQHMEV